MDRSTPLDSGQEHSTGQWTGAVHWTVGRSTPLNSGQEQPTGQWAVSAPLDRGGPNPVRLVGPGLLLAHRQLGPRGVVGWLTGWLHVQTVTGDGAARHRRRRVSHGGSADLDSAEHDGADAECSTCIVHAFCEGTAWFAVS